MTHDNQNLIAELAQALKEARPMVKIHAEDTGGARAQLTLKQVDDALKNHETWREQTRGK